MGWFRDTFSNGTFQGDPNPKGDGWKGTRQGDPEPKGTFQGDPNSPLGKVIKITIEKG